MFNSVALDVVIGLVFIFLLYSLLTTIISELIATMLGLRARNLKEAIDLMLSDEKRPGGKWYIWWTRFLDTMRIRKNPKNPVINAFYNHPEIKYQGSSGVFKLPSYFKAVSFSRTLLGLIFGAEPITKALVNKKLKDLKIRGLDSKGIETEEKIGKESAEYINILWREAEGDIEKFRSLLEKWFDRTMEHAIEWYKRKIRIVNLIVGFFIAWTFNADTFVTVKNLSTDKQAREQLVSMANAYIESNQYAKDTADIKDTIAQKEIMDRIDSLLVIKNRVEADITKANSILGVGCRLPDKFTVKKDIITKNKIKDTVLTSIPPVEVKYLKCRYDTLTVGKELNINTKCSNQWNYFFWLFPHHFFGFLITAIAVSLGAPFWFDLLNKMVKLKTPKKEPENPPSKS